MARRAPLLAALVLLSALAQALIAAPRADAAACTTSWTNASGGRWTTASNWSAGVPDANDVACIQLAGTYHVEVRAYDDQPGNGLATAQELHLGGLSGTQTLLISGANLTVPADPTPVGANLVLAGGAGSASDVGDNGVIAMQAVNSSTTAELCAGSPITSDGKITTAGSSGPAISLRGTIKNQGEMTIDKDATLQGSAGCGTNQLENDGGTVTIGNSRTLAVDGTYAQGSGTTDLKEDGDLTVGDTGSLSVTGGSFVGANAPLVQGSLVAPGGSGTFSMQGVSALDSDVGPDVTVNIEGTAAEDGSVSTVGGAGTNAGTINLTSLDSSHGALLTATDTLTNTGEIVALPVAGGIRNLGGAIVNQGLLQIGAIFAGAEVGTDLVLTNTGTVAIDEGGKLTLDDDTLNQNGGTLTVNGHLDYGARTLSLAGGKLNGTGLVKASLLANVGAEVHPGASPGMLIVDGSFHQGASGTLAIEIQGPALGTEFSQLAMSGSASLGGTLKVATTGQQTESFRVLSASGVTGSFATTQFTGQSFDVSYDSAGVVLTPPTPPPAFSKRPSIAGVRRVGNVLTCDKGIWVPQGSPFTYAYQWRRNGVPLLATTPTRKVVAADQGQKLSCRVTATGAGGSTSAISDPVSVPREPVQPGRFLKKTLRATAAGKVTVPIRNPNPLSAKGVLTLRNAKGKVVGRTTFQVAARSTKGVTVQLSQGIRQQLASGQVKLGAGLVLSRGKVKRTAKTTLTVRPPA